ncbi:FliM/FliN family flagellar motor C-terminal domain-containing protein [Shimia sp. SDUM112013]|uniref:FliM/FliN family flagellar motor C-terminal domain-containing protein n=1 Tax=Shimia sp. SDUM112013 TaxID=3136160 RepID=UPI0032EB911A
MEKDGSLSQILRRKTTRKQPPDAPAVTLGRQLALAFERSARDAVGLAFEVENCRHSDCSISDLPSLLPDKALWCLLDNGGGDVAALSVDMQVLAGLVEFQTLGCVLKQPASDRVPTRVDGALVMAVADEALLRLTKGTPEGGETDWARHFHYGAMVESRRALILSLMSDDFHLYDMDVTLEDGAKCGRVQIAFPQPRPQQDHAEEEDLCEVRQDAFRNEVRQAQTVVEAVLGRITLPYKRLSELAVGDVLDLPADCLGAVTLEVEGDVVLTKASLGQLGGLRAVRVDLPAEASAGQDGENQPYDPVQERPQTPDVAALQDNTDFLPPVEDAALDTSQGGAPEEVTAAQDRFDDDGVEDFSDLEDLDNLDGPGDDLEFDAPVPQAASA